MILSSDGLFLVYNYDQLAKEIYEMRQDGYDLIEITKKISDECCTNYNCRDNISIVIIDLKKHYQDYNKLKQEMMSDVSGVVTLKNMLIVGVSGFIGYLIAGRK